MDLQSMCRLFKSGQRHFNSRVRAKTKKEAERVGKYMIRPLLYLLS